MIDVPRVPFNVLGHKYLVRSYNTKQEKTVLLLQQLQDSDPEYCIDETLRLFGFLEDNNYDLNELTLKEKKLLIYLYRGISVGDEQALNFPCSKCKAPNTTHITFDFYDKLKEFKGIKIIDEELTFDNQDKFCSEDFLKALNVQSIYDLEIDDYEEALKKIKTAQEALNFRKDLTCRNCGTVSSLDCSKIEFILEHISEENLMMIYETITTLIRVGYTLQDVESLIPFERVILMEQMSKQLETNET